MSDTSDKTILIVDDEPDVQLYLRTILEDAGFDVMVASNGKQALERMTEKKPDAISLDLVMPKMSGLKFYRYIQKNKDRKDIPVVVVTAHGKDEFGSDSLRELQQEAKNNPITFLEKPVKPPAYISAIRKSLGLPTSGEEHGLREQIQDRLKTADDKKLKKVLKLLSD
ncbi:MAG: response regulator [Elusimicrobiota bacterium]